MAVAEAQAAAAMAILPRLWRRRSGGEAAEAPVAETPAPAVADAPAAVAVAEAPEGAVAEAPVAVAMAFIPRLRQGLVAAATQQHGWS